MTPNDFIYNQIYKTCLAQKVNERVAQQHAVMGLERYKKNKFAKGKVDLMIKEVVEQAKKQSKGLK